MLESKVMALDKEKVNSRIVYHGLKRCFDIIAASFGLLILSPLLITIALMIKREDHGPVFYKQIRVSKDGRKFKMYKFRSMFVNADQMLDELKEKMMSKDPCLR